MNIKINIIWCQNMRAHLKKRGLSLFSEIKMSTDLSQANKVVNLLNQVNYILFGLLNMWVLSLFSTIEWGLLSQFAGKLTCLRLLCSFLVGFSGSQRPLQNSPRLHYGRSVQVTLVLILTIFLIGELLFFLNICILETDLFDVSL